MPKAPMRDTNFESCKRRDTFSTSPMKTSTSPNRGVACVTTSGVLQTQYLKLLKLDVPAAHIRPQVLNNHMSCDTSRGVTHSSLGSSFLKSAPEASRVPVRPLAMPPASYTPPLKPAGLAANEHCVSSFSLLESASTLGFHAGDIL
jgi:hypothetical protein